MSNSSDAYHEFAAALARLTADELQDVIEGRRPDFAQETGRLRDENAKLRDICDCFRQAARFGLESIVPASLDGYSDPGGHILFATDMLKMRGVVAELRKENDRLKAELDAFEQLDLVPRCGGWKVELGKGNFDTFGTRAEAVAARRKAAGLEDLL